MSGAEIASFTLAVLPLLISAAEHYRDMFQPFNRYRKFAAKVKRYQEELEIQKTIFHNQCRLLLEYVVDHDVASAMLVEQSHPFWTNGAVDTSLAQLLGDSREACCTVIRLIDETTQEIDQETQPLEAIVSNDPKVRFTCDNFTSGSSIE